jgi:NDP-sugar pyrophosphorylase family protein
MQVMLLAAGRSTRLGALGVARPKPLVPICGYPAILYCLHRCALAGLRDVVINLHHHGDQIRAAVGDGSAFGLRVRYSQEDELLGTGGGIARARTLFHSEPVLVMNGKVVADIALESVVAAHRSTAPGKLATMVVRREENPGQFAPVAIDESARVVALRGAPSAVRATGALTNRMFTGIHILEAGLLDRLPREGASDVIADGYQLALAEGGRIQALDFSGYFEEHSTPERYLQGNLALLRQPSLLGSAPGALVGIDPGARVSEGAEVRAPVRIAAGAIVEAGARVGPDVVVGAGAHVGAGARLERVVVWDGVQTAEVITDAVITPQGLVRVP